MWHKEVRWHHVESDILKEGPGTETSYQIIQYTSMATPTFGMYVSYKEFILITKIAAMMFGMYIKMEYTGQNHGLQEETHHPTNRFWRLFFDLILVGWRGCASAIGVIKIPIRLF